MKISVKRFEFGTNYTIGKLYIDDRYVCYTLEDKVREGIKILGETAIPIGTYPITIDFSNRFQKDMIHVLDIPLFDGIRIHSGNTDKDTAGCILVGMAWAGSDFIGLSKQALGQVFGAVSKALADKDTVKLEITNAA